MSTAGKFGPYSLAGPYSQTGPYSQSGADLVRSRIALQVRLALLRPGDRLPDTGALAEQLGIGEMTVRRALEGMCQDGLLDRRRGRTGGTFVSAAFDAVVPAHHDPAAAASAEAFLLLLECGLVAHASGEVGEADLGSLRKLVAEAEEAGQEEQAGQEGERERETRFHLELAETLGGPGLRAVTADLLGRLALLAPPPGPEAIRRRSRCHAELLDHLVEGRTDRAVRAVKDHAIHR
ncbi:FadR/GntR family transcriptional regulator [Streptacidiphilus fuscans]|uniref:FadR/GntR family transcriptional regulator n=1 Tax=Streptacidiphilus fuscans TaxID=2789292 RepID=UPI002E2918DC|nr:GntR family transcriptional regulator [Streptacidiphilus fuscans]